MLSALVLPLLRRCRAMEFAGNEGSIPFTRSNLDLEQ
jgi:hypothetical protein